ncbi:MAG: hypothetical protein H6741_20180 [Alphaproteobacteria bacterium]|nr:hypothetical protein [Alphaproteobacteria bacterium]
MFEELESMGRYPMAADGRWLEGFPRCLQACAEGVLMGGGRGLQLLDPATLEIRRTIFEAGAVLRLTRVFDGQVYALVTGAGHGEGLSTDTGARVLRIPLDGGPPTRVLSLTWSHVPIAADAQGTLLVSTEEDVVRRLPLAGEELEPLRLKRKKGDAFDRPQVLKALAVSASGRWIAAGFDHHTWVWDTSRGKRAQIYASDAGLDVSEDGVCWVGGGRTRAFGPDGASQGEGAGILSSDVVRASPDGRWLVTANHWGHHELLRLPGLETARSLRERGNTSWHGWTFDVAAITDTHLVQISDRYGWIRAWAHGEDQPCAERGGITWGVKHMGVGGGRVAWSTDSPRSLRLLEVDGGLQWVEFGSTCGPDEVSLSPDGQRVLSVEAPFGFGSKRAAVIRRFDDGEELESVTLRASGEHARFSPTGELYAVGMGSYDSSGEVLVRAPGASRGKKRVKDPEGGPLSLGWREDGQALAIGWRERVELLPLSKGGAAGSWPSQRAIAVALAPDDEIVISEAWDTQLRRLSDGRRLTLHDVCWSLRFSPDGAQLYAGLGDGQILVLSPALELIEVLRAHSDKVTALHWSEGALWSSSEDGTIRRWLR